MIFLLYIGVFKVPAANLWGGVKPRKTLKAAEVCLLCGIRLSEENLSGVNPLGCQSPPGLLHFQQGIPTLPLLLSGEQIPNLLFTSKKNYVCLSGRDQERLTQRYFQNYRQPFSKQNASKFRLLQVWTYTRYEAVDYCLGVVSNMFYFHPENWGRFPF